MERQVRAEPTHPLDVGKRIINFPVHLHGVGNLVPGVWRAWMLIHVSFFPFALRPVASRPRGSILKPSIPADNRLLWILQSEAIFLSDARILRRLRTESLEHCDAALIAGKTPRKIHVHRKLQLRH